MEQALGACPADDSGFWAPPDFWDSEDLAAEIGDQPCVWTDGSLEPHLAAGFAVAGAGVYLPGVVLSCRYWALNRRFNMLNFGCDFGLASFWPAHLGIDNRNVVPSIPRLLDHGRFSKPLPLGKDGDLTAVVRLMILARGRTR